MKTIEHCVSQQDFELGMSGRILPEDIDPREPYTLRRILSPEERAEEAFAEDLVVTIISVAMRRGHFEVPTICPEGVEHFDVTPDGVIVVNGDVESLGSVEGYFLGAELLDRDLAEEYEDMVLAPLVPRQQAEPLKTLAIPLPTPNTTYLS